jgi:hypothetical protein
MFRLSRVMRWAAGPCLALNMLCMGAAVGKTKLPEAAADLCNAPLGATLLQANDLKLPAQAIWQNRSDILLPASLYKTATLGCWQAPWMANCVCKQARC